MPDTSRTLPAVRALLRAAASALVMALPLTAAKAEDAAVVPASDPEAQTPPPSAASTSSAFGFLALRPPPPDIAAFPARLPVRPERDELGVEVHGFVVGWITPWSEASPTSTHDTYRLRFGVLRIDARPAQNVSVLARLGLMLPTSPLLDFALTYTPHPAFGVTVGQFRLPIGAAATTLAPQLVLLDRPTYVYAMTKLAFRDVGVMLHSSPRGIAGGVFHYRLVAASGGGRVGVGASRVLDDLTKSLLAARAIVDFAPFISAERADRLALGVSYTRSNDPAIATGDPARDRELAVNVLGRSLTPTNLERVTQLAGADLTFVYGPLYSQAELLYLHSKASHASVQRAGFGTNLDLGYTLPLHPWRALDLQLALRGEHFNPRLGRDDLPDSAVQLLTLGLNAIAGNVRASVFGTLTFFEDQTTHTHRRAGEITLRTAASF
jgi:hypothetical protein